MFLTDTTFQKIIEELVSSKRMSYLDAVVHYCKENELDPEDVTKLISSNLKDKIKIDAMEDGFMRRESRLPGL